MSGFFDEYEIRARLQPALLVLLPALLSLVAVFPSLRSVSHATIFVVVWLGVGALLSRLGRDAGKRKEAALFLSWGGKPTTIALRHRDGWIVPPTKARYHHKLSHLVGLKFPSYDDEVRDPLAADDIYESGATWLRERTRSRSTFPLIFKENCHYGFSRNLWGMKWWGIILIAASLCGDVSTIIYSWSTYSKPALAGTPVFIVGASVLCLVMLLVWIFGITEQFVRSAAMAYARALLAACDAL